MNSPAPSKYGSSQLSADDQSAVCVFCSTRTQLLLQLFLRLLQHGALRFSVEWLDTKLQTFRSDFNSLQAVRGNALSDRPARGRSQKKQGEIGRDEQFARGVRGEGVRGWCTYWRLRL